MPEAYPLKPIPALGRKHCQQQQHEPGLEHAAWTEPEQQSVLEDPPRTSPPEGWDPEC